MQTATAAPATATRSRVVRLGRGALAMVLFAVPFVLIGYAVRQKFDPLIHLDNAIADRATDATRAIGAGPALITLQAVSQPWVLYIAATLVCVWAWVAKKLRNRAWYRVWASADPATGMMRVGQQPLKRAFAFDDEGEAGTTAAGLMIEAGQPVLHDRRQGNIRYRLLNLKSTTDLDRVCDCI